MISLRKLESLSPGTRLRKIIRLLDGFVHYRTVPDVTYLRGLIRLACEAANEMNPSGPEASTFTARLGELCAAQLPLPEASSAEMTRHLDRLRHLLRTIMNTPVADWDLLAPAGYGLVEEHQGDVGATPAIRAPGPVRIYLESIRSPFNVGSILRTASALGITHVGVSPDCPPVDHPRVRKTARGAQYGVVISRASLSDLPDEWQPFIALETGGDPVDDYPFPSSGTLVVGSEELGLTSEALGRAVGRVSIPMRGLKASLNVGVACGIALHAWIVKSLVSDSDA